MTQYVVSLDTIMTTATAAAATKIGASLRWVDFTSHINELLSYVLGYKRYRDIKHGQIYNDLIVVCPKTDIVVDAIIDVVKTIDHRISTVTNEKVHYNVMSVCVLDKKSLLLEINVSEL